MATNEESTTLQKCVTLPNITCSRLTKWISAGGTIATTPPATRRGMNVSRRTNGLSAEPYGILTRISVRPPSPRGGLGCSQKHVKGDSEMRKLLLAAVAALALAAAAPALAADPTTGGTATITNGVATLVSNTSVANTPADDFGYVQLP